MTPAVNFCTVVSDVGPLFIGSVTWGSAARRSLMTPGAFIRISAPVVATPATCVKGLFTP
jgi:hypothetical protein